MSVEVESCVKYTHKRCHSAKKLQSDRWFSVMYSLVFSVK